MYSEAHTWSSIRSWASHLSWRSRWSYSWPSYGSWLTWGASRTRRSHWSCRTTGSPLPTKTGSSCQTRLSRFTTLSLATRQTWWTLPSGGTSRSSRTTRSTFSWGSWNSTLNKILYCRKQLYPASNFIFHILRL